MKKGLNTDTTNELRGELFDVFIEEDLPSSMKISNILIAEDEEFYRELAKFNKHANERLRKLALIAAQELAKGPDFDKLYAQLEGNVDEVAFSDEEQELIDQAPTEEWKALKEEEDKRKLAKMEEEKAKRETKERPAPVPPVSVAKPSNPVSAPQVAVVQPSRTEQPKVLSEEEKRNARHLPYLEKFIEKYAEVKKSQLYSKAQQLATMEKTLKEYMVDTSDVIRKKAIEVWNELATKYSLGTKVEFKPSQLPPEKSAGPSAVNIEKLYNEQRKPKIPHKGSLSQFASKIKKNVVSTFAQNPARKKQVKALQELANQALQSGPQANERMLDYYCALHLIRAEIKKENNKLPSALENVCKELMSKIESSPEHFKKITEVYCKKYNLPENSGFNVKHMHLIAKEALDGTDTYKNDNKKKPRI
ncbi:MAG: hypothetical protein AB7I18_01885 [Candidatus Berkiella sp.]